MTRRLVFLLALPVLTAGCAGAQITGVEAPNPEAPVLVVHLEVEGLAHKQQKCNIVAEWNGWKAVAAVPQRAGGALEKVRVELTRWEKAGRSRLPVGIMEVRFTFPHLRRAIARKRVPSPWSNVDVFLNRRRPPPPRPDDRQPPPVVEKRKTPNSFPKAWGSPRDYSHNLDKPTTHDLSKPIVCQLDVNSGPRYVKVAKPPNKLVKLIVDVRSKGSPKHTGESTWWRVELLDQDGLAMPHEIQEFVGLGQDARHIAKWRFDGSAVIFKLSSASQAGDWIRIRFKYD